MNRLSALLLRVARALLPPKLARWGQAAAAELLFIPCPPARLRFALGCLCWAAGAALSARLSRLQATRPEPPMSRLPNDQRATGLLCALAATGLGLLYMRLAGAPASYLMINVGALICGLLGLAIVSLAEQRGHLPAGPLNLALGALILAVAVWGAEADGVARWLNLGGLVVQPSLVVLPLMLGLFARAPGWTAAGGLLVAALGLALQPDRAMAGALAAGLLALVLVRPGRPALLALLGAGAAFAVTLAAPDPSPAVPFVDRILYSAFDVHPLAGVAVVAGSVLLIAPALLFWRPGPGAVVFGACWAAIVLAAALGNYPTPLVGYSGSAIVGYLLSLILLPRRARRPAAELEAPARASGDPEPPALYAAA